MHGYNIPDDPYDGCTDKEWIYGEDRNWNLVLVMQGDWVWSHKLFYDPYGTYTTEDAPQGSGEECESLAYTFQGRPREAYTGLFYFRNRWYRPELGRFLQRDPSGYADGMNLYEFCSGRPLAAADPKGLQLKYKTSRNTFKPCFFLTTRQNFSYWLVYKEVGSDKEVGGPLQGILRGAAAVGAVPLSPIAGISPWSPSPDEIGRKLGQLRYKVGRIRGAEKALMDIPMGEKGDVDLQEWYTPDVKLVAKIGFEQCEWNWFAESGCWYETTAEYDCTKDLFKGMSAQWRKYIGGHEGGISPRKLDRIAREDMKTPAHRPQLTALMADLCLSCAKQAVGDTK